MNDDGFNAKGLILGILMGGLVAGLAVWDGRDAKWHREAVERGFAEYHQTTGDWQWKTNVLVEAYEGKRMPPLPHPATRGNEPVVMPPMPFPSH